jgi:tetratricopeptide (TPR) repeat protein
LEKPSQSDKKQQDADGDERSHARADASSLVLPVDRLTKAKSTMRWLQTEYMLKGVYLGLLLYVAVQKPEWDQNALLALYTLGGLALALGIAAVRKLREGFRVRGRLLSFLLFLLLENPFLVYVGILAGMTAGAFALFPPEPDDWVFAGALAGGAVVGSGFWLLPHLRDRRLRLGLTFVLAAALGGSVIYWSQYAEISSHARAMFGVLLLLGIPLFYLLTFAGLAEESEVEIGAMCAALLVGLWSVGEQISPSFAIYAVVIPLLFYFVYTKRILPGLRVFKHVLRGLSYSRIGQYRPALVELKRALQLDARNALARETLWGVHREMDFDLVVKDPATLALVDFDLCLERAGSLLLASPRPEQLVEAQRLLDMAAGQRPDMAPACHYWRSVAFTHARQYDRAAAELEQVVVPTPEGARNAYRSAILMSAWQMALTLHPEMHRRVGTPQLLQPGRRMEAIAAVERFLATAPDDADTWNLKRVLYSDLTEAEYTAAAPEQPARDFEHAYVHQLGLALINDPSRWSRGAEFMRVAAHGLPTLAPAIFIELAKAHDRAGDADGVWNNYHRVKVAGKAVGAKNLSDQDRHAFFAVIKLLADDAIGRGDLDEAIEDYHLYQEYERSGKETYRALAGLYEKKKDPWAALRATEQGLVYDSQDKDLLEKKDRYYYSVMPGELRERWDSVFKYFDVAYCLQKSQALLKVSGSDFDLLDWAQHLADLALVARPGSQAAKVVRARLRLQRGERDEALALLEDVRVNKPEKFASGEDEDAWFATCKLLGTMYLNELNRPDLAVECFQDFRKSARSGADTMYRLGEAYEAIGDKGRAVKCYKQVTAFDSHPLTPDAHDALRRLGAEAG